MSTPGRRQNTSYLTLKERLRQEINALGAGESTEGLLSQHNLRERYGVSRPTISKALAELAAEGLIVRGSDRSTYMPAKSVPSPPIASASRDAVGYVAASSTEVVSQSAFRGIRRVARRDGFHAVMAVGDDIRHEREAVHELIASGVKGLIINPGMRLLDTRDMEYLGREDLGIPVVLMDTCSPDQGPAQVVFDNRTAAYDLTRLLLDRGHTRIATVLEFQDRYHAGLSERVSGYRDALREAGIAPDDSLSRNCDVNLSLASDSLMLNELLSIPDPPTAFVTLNEVLAIELIQALMRRGIRVPEDIAVASFDRTALSTHFNPQFPSTKPDFERMGELACKKLLDTIESGLPMTASRYVLPIPLVNTSCIPRRQEAIASRRALRAAADPIIY